MSPSIQRHGAGRGEPSTAGDGGAPAVRGDAEEGLHDEYREERGFGA